MKENFNEKKGEEGEPLLIIEERKALVVFGFVFAWPIGGTSLSSFFTQSGES
jgi:hypothetical protein